MGLDLALHVEHMTPPICWETVFGNSHPVDIEIGSGKGRFLYEVASRFPDRNFVGIEHWRKRYLYTLQRITKHALTNARVTDVDAVPFIEEFVGPNSVSAFHIYFPDPWPKRRHHKRRIFQPGFVEILSERLREKGRIYFATDFRAYAEIVHHQLDTCERLVQVLPTPEPMAPTNFEIKYLMEGRTIYRYAYERVEIRP